MSLNCFYSPTNSWKTQRLNIQSATNLSHFPSNQDWNNYPIIKGVISFPSGHLSDFLINQVIDGDLLKTDLTIKTQIELTMWQQKWFLSISRSAGFIDRETNRVSPGPQRKWRVGVRERKEAGWDVQAEPLTAWDENTLPETDGIADLCSRCSCLSHASLNMFPSFLSEHPSVRPGWDWLRIHASEGNRICCFSAESLSCVDSAKQSANMWLEESLVRGPSGTARCPICGRSTIRPICLTSCLFSAKIDMAACVGIHARHTVIPDFGDLLSPLTVSIWVHLLLSLTFDTRRWTSQLTHDRLSSSTWFE